MRELTEIVTVQLTTIFKGDEIDELASPEHIERQVKEDIKDYFGECDDIQVQVQHFLMEKEDKKWPQEGDTYWYVTSGGSVCDSIFTNGEITDVPAMKFGNFFKTKDDALVARGSIERLLQNLNAYFNR